jgi:purine-nucleoside phosphorylase
MLHRQDEIARSAARLREAAAEAGLGAVPPTAVLLGTGWHGLTARVQGAVNLGYVELPAFPTLSVAGHAGRALLGHIEDRPVLVLAGRQHAYETGEPAAMRGVIATLAACGVRTLVQTNAAGSLQASLPPGSVMLLADHLNLVQRSPLVGAAGEGADGSDARFVDMAQAYDLALRAQARGVAERLGQPLREGVYAWVLGPQFETPAEIRMLQRLGADAVGMSTVPETILARHAGLKVLALSLITNMGCGLSDEPLGHAHTLRMAEAAGSAAVDLLGAILAEIG